MFDKIEKEVDNIATFLKQQNNNARAMKEESNHLIEYYTVMKKAGKMIFGENAVNRPSFDLKMKSPRGSEVLGLVGKGSPTGFDSDNSDDFFNQADSKFKQCA